MQSTHPRSPQLEDNFVIERDLVFARAAQNLEGYLVSYLVSLDAGFLFHT